MASVEGRVSMTGANGYLIIADIRAGHELDCLGIAVVGPYNSVARLVGGSQRGEEGVSLVGVGNTTPRHSEDGGLARTLSIRAAAKR